MARIPRAVWSAEHAEYLASARWQEVRADAITRAFGKCERCGKPARQVHHRTYARLGGSERASDLEALCAGCHMRRHGIGKPAKKGKDGKAARRRECERNVARKARNRAWNAEQAAVKKALKAKGFDPEHGMIPIVRLGKLMPTKR